MENEPSITREFNAAAQLPDATRHTIDVERLPAAERASYDDMTRKQAELRTATAEGLVRDRSERIEQVYADNLAHQSQRPVAEQKLRQPGLQPVPQGERERQARRDAEWRVFQYETSRLQLFDERARSSRERFVEAALARAAERERGGPSLENVAQREARGRGDSGR